MREWPLNELPGEVASMLNTLAPDIDFIDLTCRFARLQHRVC